MSFLSAGERLVEILTNAIGGSPDLNAADGSDTLRNNITLKDVRYGLADDVLIQPFPNIVVARKRVEFLPKMETGHGQTRMQTFQISIYSEVSGHGQTNTPTVDQIYAAEQDVTILGQNIVRILMPEVQDSSTAQEWYLMTLPDLVIEDITAEDGFWVKTGRMFVTVEHDFSYT